jgi:hypothetical protein
VRNRYKVTGPWGPASGLLSRRGSFIIQSADITDQVNGRVYQDGAYRVVRAGTHKPAKVGKGGTVPFYGEMAWADAERLASDLALAEQYAR